MAGDIASANLQTILEQSCEKVRKPRFSVLFRHGDRTSGMFVVLSGKVSLGFGVNSAFDRSYGPGALVGLPSTLTRRNYCMTATVTEDAELGFWSPEALDSLLHNRPDLCQQLLVILGEKMAENYELFVQRAKSSLKTRRSPMAQVRGLSPGTTHVGSLPLPSGTKRRRLALSFAVAGALSFWLPDVVVHVDAGPNFDSRHVWVCTILMAATFLFAYVVARRFGMKRDFKWVGPAMLLGVWLTGGLFITLATASGSGFVGVDGVGRLLIIVLSVIPIVTFILATVDGSVFALLVVTLGALLLLGFRAIRILLASGRPSLVMTSNEESASQQQSKVA